MTLIACKECQREISDSAQACPGCGMPLSNFVPLQLVSGSEPERKSRSLAILLAFVFGTFGAHRFYLGQPKWGYLYAVLCWTGVPTLLGLIEAVTYLFMSDDDFHYNYIVYPNVGGSTS